MPGGRSFKRVLLKLSGEIFARTDFSCSESSDDLLETVISQLAVLHRQQLEIAIVIGGGNILRGRDTVDMDRATADQAGMLGTVVNGLRLTDTLQNRALKAVHLSARAVPGIVAGYDVTTAREAIGRNILVLSGGTGNPFFSTDSTAALRAVELHCELLLKGTNVDGVYSGDPKKDPEARRYPRLTYQQALTEQLRVMDLTAFALCMEHRLPIQVFDLRQPDAIINIIDGKQIGSCVC